jgi:hypothetical protein
MTVNTVERARRISDLWSRRPDMTEAAVERQVDAQLAAEEAVAADARARADEFTASATALMFRCGACGGTRTSSATDALCDACRAVMVVVKAERLFDEQIDGHSRRALVEQYLAQQKAG